MDEKISGELFGITDARSRVFGNEPTSEDLDALLVPPSAEDGEAIHVFCVGHHSVLSISLAGRTELMKLTGKEAPQDWDGKYFQVSGCPFCLGGGLFRDPVLKDLRM